jgi:putative transposase
MKVSRSAYYEWRSQRTYQTSQMKKEIENQIKVSFAEHKSRYGARRLVHEMALKGVKVTRYKTGSIMRKLNLTAIQPKSFVPRTTDSRHSYRISPNLLAGKAWPDKVNEVWVCDITFIPLNNGRWCYLAVVMDLKSRKIVGWQIGNNMGEQLVIDALKNAIGRRKLKPGLIIHSDRGGQYASRRYRELIKAYGMNQSMSEADNPYDNAFMESCFSRIKAELIGNKAYSTVEDARAEIFEYIESYYNRKRLHSGLGYKTPDGYEQDLKNGLTSTCTNNRRYVIPKKDFSERGIDPLTLKHKQNSSSLPKEQEYF